MTQINLLPWREQQRKERKLYFAIALGISAFSAILFMLTVHFSLSYKVERQQQRNSLLQAEINKYNSKIRAINDLKKLKASLITRLDIIQALQTNRPLTVHFFDELVNVLPEGVFLSKALRQDNNITLVGLAESNTSVSQLMRGVDSSKWLSNPILSEIKEANNTNKGLNEFRMQLLLNNIKVDEKAHS